MNSHRLKFADLNYVERLDDGLNDGGATTRRGQTHASIESMSTIGEENNKWNILTEIEKSGYILNTHNTQSTMSLMERSGVHIPLETQIA